MKRLIFLACLISISLASYTQVKYKTVKTHVENGTTLTRIRLDEQLTPNAEGNYCFKMKAPIPFTSFAIGWDATDRNAAEGNFNVYYRTSQGEKWTNWQDDHGYFRPEDIEPNIFYTDLLFGFDFNPHDSLEFIIMPPVNVELTKIELVFQDIISENEKAANQTVTANTTRDGDCLEFPEYIPRSSWCANYSECLNPTYDVVNINCTHTIIHHGASPYSYTDGAAVVRSYWNYHVNSNGWSDIGYNYLFDKNGNMFQGRHNPNLPTTDVKGAHAGNCNSKSIGLNFIGHSDTLATAPTIIQLEKCWDMLAWWYDHKQLDPTSTADITNQAGEFTFSRFRISGHRDVNQTASGSLGTTCPGQTLYDMLPNFRIQVASRMNNCGWNIDIPAEDTLPPSSEITTNNWLNSNSKVSFADRGSASQAFYQIVDKENGKLSANNAKGFLYENFDETTLPNGWTPTVGTWQMNSGSIIQTDESLTSTNFNFNLSQNRSGIYLYHVKMKISGEGENRRSGFYFFCDSERQNGYMMFIRPDQNTVQLYKYVNGSYSENGGTYTSHTHTINADQWYDIKITFDTQSGSIKCYVDDIMAVSLTDNNPFASGNIISLRTAECKTEYKDFYVCRSRNVNDNIAITIGENGDIRNESQNGEYAGKVRTILLGFNNLWSEYYEKDVKADITAPETEISADNWDGNEIEVTFDDTDNNYVADRFYCPRSFNGARWESTNANGFACNDFDNEIGSEWTAVAGNWSIENGYLKQSESGTSNIYSTVAQNISDKYMYEFCFKMTSGVNNQRVGLHYMSTNGTTENHGDGYFIYFRLSNSSKRIEFYRVENNTYSQEKCIDLPVNAENWHYVKLIYDRTNGTSSIYFDNKYYGSYTDPNFFTTGNIVALRNGGAAVLFDNFRIYRSHGNTAIITVGPNGDIANVSSDSTDYAQILSIATDSANNISDVCQYSLTTGETVHIDSIDEQLSAMPNLFPNPNNGSFYIEVGAGNIGKEITIINMLGEIVEKRIANSDVEEISLEHISSGLYFVKIGRKTIKFIKN